MTDTTKEESKILLVEDELDLLEMLRAYFRVQGYEIAVAARGEDAVTAVSEELPDIIVLDICLPDIDGYEVCRRIRQQRRFQHIPIIFLTEMREREDRLAGLEMGAVDYITKPFDIQELRLRIRNALRRARLSTTQNPVTGLSEGPPVRERLNQLLKSSDWGVVLAGVRNLGKFRDQFGFVAADDVARAIALMIGNAVNEVGSGEEFIGHTDAGDFIILTTSDRCRKLAERCQDRLLPSIQYFYPAFERKGLHDLPESERLSVRVASVASNDSVAHDVESVLSALEKETL